MRTLAIDSTTAACSLALFEGDDLITGIYEEIGRGHAERLVPMVAQLPHRGRAERICVSLGPGSFTGVRIGIAAARALGLAWGARVLGFNTLALVAAMARDRDPSPVSVAMTGGHGEWFVQDYDRLGLPEGEIASLSPTHAAQTAVHTLVAGDQAHALVDIRGSGTAKIVLPDVRALLKLPGALLRTSLAPQYGRGPDARLPLA